MTDLRGSQVGPQIAELLGLSWTPEARAGTDTDTEVTGWITFDESVALYLGGGLGASGGAWLTIVYLHAARAPGGAASEDACGSGAGTRLMAALRTWSESSQLPLRFTSVENPAFFDRFSWLEAETVEDYWYSPTSHDG